MGGGREAIGGKTPIGGGILVLTPAKLVGGGMGSPGGGKACGKLGGGPDRRRAGGGSPGGGI